MLEKFSHMDASWLTAPAPDNFSDILLKSFPPNPHSMRQNKLCVFPSRYCKSETHCLLSGLLKFLTP